MNKLASIHEKSLTDSSITELDAEALESVVGGGLSLGDNCTSYGSATFETDGNGFGVAVYL